MEGDVLLNKFLGQTLLQLLFGKRVAAVKNDYTLFLLCQSCHELCHENGFAHS